MSTGVVGFEHGSEAGRSSSLHCSVGQQSFEWDVSSRREPGGEEEEPGAYDFRGGCRGDVNI